MPMIGPVGNLAISAAVTQVGAEAVPAASRAELRFKAGYNLPSILAYTAPV